MRPRRTPRRPSRRLIRDERSAVSSTSTARWPTRRGSSSGSGAPGRLNTVSMPRRCFGSRRSNWRTGWALSTSLPDGLLATRMAAAGLPIPVTVVTSDQVTHGKPDPECYLLAARKLGVPTRDCVVVEDAPAGLRAAKAAGATADALAPCADYVISSLNQIQLTDRGVETEDS